MVPSIGREITVIGPDTAHSARVLTPEGLGFVRRTRGRTLPPGCSTSS